MALRATTLVALTALACLSTACGGSTDKDDANNPLGTGGEGAGGGAGTGGNDIFTPGTADRCKNGPKTSYLNDELCLEPPKPEQGFQIHFGPAADADYDDPAVLEPFILRPTEEGVLCQAAITPNEEEAFSQEQHIRIRTGTHHIILWRAVDDKVVGPEAGTLQKDGCRAGNYVFFIGSEAGLTEAGAKLDVPLPGATSAYGEDDKGIAMRIRPKTPIWVETHFVNTTERDMLREGWANVIYTDKTKVTTVMDPIFFIGGVGMNVPPQTTQVVNAGPTKNPLIAGVQQEVRMMGIAGHVHAHTTRESVFLNHADGSKDLVYQSFNWAEPLFAQFDDVHTNPAMGEADKDGALSGKLIIKPGEGLSWECEVNNTLDNISLRFADRAYDAEMCNVFGYYVPGNGLAWNQVF